MKTIKLLIIASIVMSVSSFAVEPAVSIPTSSAAAQSKVKVQRAPVIGSMLEDGREVPTRFQGVESKEQRARRENQEQKQPGSEKE